MKYCLSIILLVMVWSLSGQGTKRVKGEYKMRIDPSISENQAKRDAVQQAKVNALENEFGSRVGMMNRLMMENAGGQTNTSFSSISNSLVKGIWLKDLSEPQFEFYYEGDDRWLSAKVEGRARGIDNSGLKLEVKPVKCPDVNCFSQEYKQNDQMMLYFRSPENGYLSVYVDDKSKAYLLLPYKSMDGGSVPVEADKEYVFFKTTEEYNYFSNQLTDIDEITLYTPYDYEVDLLYVLFSKEPFSRPIMNDNGPEVPKTISSTKFNDWLAEIMSYETMHMEVIDISISQ